MTSTQKSANLNHYMHPRNIYKNNPLNFNELSRLYREFKTVVKQGQSGKAFVDFRNPSTVRILSKCLLHKDFQLDISLPPNRLAPTVPSRLNYILWIQDLLNATFTEELERHIIDIGTGSSCIYPLLGVKTDPNWRFTATELDDVNFKNALRNVEANSFNDRIRVVEVLPECKTLLKHLVEGNTDKFDCCMCNPPFFSNFKESLGRPERPVANSSCHAGHIEAITKGGDLAFATKLFEESLELKGRLTWCTIMFGKKSSFVAARSLLSKKEPEILFWTSYEFCQGNTIRWGLAWTFCPHLVDKSKIPISPLKLAAKETKAVKPISFSMTNPVSVASAYSSLKNCLDELGVSVSEHSRSDNEITLFASAVKASWVHVRQRARKRKYDGGSVVDGTNGKDSSTENSVLDFVIKLACDGVSDCVNFEFKTAISNQKETLNGLVIYLKREICKPLK